ncbi:hypothetical protein B0F90DRAFT_1666834 [Multifurca ochricompacta]|uniref:CipC1 protein n=1 Tax=Multifurca ochricompacta TaxID=376703 RepID=A0AAD4QQ55_9AGAM|nr:hypothetical protein B0F90DRAFT_1666834 [Multifurca ochricompacta]
MGWFGEDHDVTQAYNEYQTNPKHESSLTHELIAGAAAFEAAKAYENHKERNGQPVDHATAKALISSSYISAGFAGAFIDKEVETRGLDFIDKEKAKHHAKRQAEEALAEAGEY